MSTPKKSPKRYPHRVLTGDTATAGQYLPLAHNLLARIDALGLPADVRTVTPEQGVTVRVRGGKAVFPHIHIDATGTEWLALVQHNGGTTEGGLPIYDAKPLYGARYPQLPWRSVINTTAADMSPRLRGCGLGWSYTVAPDLAKGAGWWKLLLIVPGGLGVVESPSYYESVVIPLGHTLVDYRIPTFCGFVSRAGGPARRRFVVAQGVNADEEPDPPGPRREPPNSDTSPNARTWRYLVWEEGQSAWEVLLPPAMPETYLDGNIVAFRYGPAVYLGNNALAVWGIGQYGGYTPGDGGGDYQYNVLQAWRSYDGGITWYVVPDTDIASSMPVTVAGATVAGLNVCGNERLEGIRAYTLGEGSLLFQLPMVEYLPDSGYYHVGTITYRAFAGVGLTRAGRALYLPLLEMFNERYQPVCLGAGAALIFGQTYNAPDFYIRRTLDYGATWTTLGPFPVDQSIGLPEHHSALAWPYEYYPCVSSYTGLPTETELLMPLQRADASGSVGVYRSVDGGATWVDSGGTISPTSLRWYTEDEGFIPVGATTPVNIIGCGSRTPSNPALPELDAVAEVS